MFTLIRACLAVCFALLGIALGIVLLITDGPGAGLSVFVGCQLVGAMIAPSV